MPGTADEPGPTMVDEAVARWTRLWLELPAPAD